MKQFCGSIDDCIFSGDLICVYCGRKMPNGYIPEEEDEEETTREKGLDIFYDDYDVDPFETKGEGTEKPLQT